MKDYTELFQQRGSTYDSAMRAFPDARRAEFEQLLAPLKLQPGMAIGDVPAGGGYLQRHLPSGCEWRGHEPCPTFTRHHGNGAEREDGRPLLPLPWRANELDAVVSLAGVHHIEDKRALFLDIARVTRSGGVFVLSDVAEGSPPALFLDGFVGEWNSTGHEGLFLGEQTRHELHDAGWAVLDASSNQYAWEFPDRPSLVEFTRQLFDICKASPARVEQAIEAGPGIVDLPDGGAGLNWELLTFTCHKEPQG